MTKDELYGRWWYRLLQVVYVIALIVAVLAVLVRVPVGGFTRELTTVQANWVGEVAKGMREKGQTATEIEEYKRDQITRYQFGNLLEAVGVLVGAVLAWLGFVLVKRIFMYVAVAEPILFRGRASRHTLR